MQQVEQRLAVGTMPFQLSACRTAMGSYRQTDLVMHQVAEQPVRTPLAVELVEDQAYHIARLLIGIHPPEGAPWHDAALWVDPNTEHPPLGKVLIGLYIGKQALESTYGAAASLVVLLIWVYYSSQLVLMGAEFTRAYARRPSNRTHGLFSAVRRDHTNIDR